MAAGSTCSCTTPVKDDTLTKIDGGHITTGEIDAKKVIVNNIDASKITTGELDAARIKANSLAIGKFTTEVQNKINKAGSDATYRGVCSNTATTYAKVVECTGFELTVGASIVVYMVNASTATSTLTLNVNNTGAKTIYVGDKATASSNRLLWAAGASVTFVYDGSYWVVADSPGTWNGGTCSSSADSDKVASCGKVVLFNGASVKLLMTYGNTSANSWLNVQSLGNRPIYFGNTYTVPTVENGYSWRAGSLVEFVFDGKDWRTGSRTYIDGGDIVTGTISGNLINGGTIKGSIIRSTIDTDDKVLQGGYAEISKSTVSFKDRNDSAYIKVHGSQTEDSRGITDSILINFIDPEGFLSTRYLNISAKQSFYNGDISNLTFYAHNSYMKLSGDHGYGEIELFAGDDESGYGFYIDVNGIYVFRRRDGTDTRKSIWGLL